jgi:hypothetical protein
MAKDVTVAQVWVAQVEPLKAARSDTSLSTTFPPFARCKLKLFLTSDAFP